MPGGDLQLRFERIYDGYLVSTDPAKLDLGAIHGFLAQSYWASTRSREAIERTLAHSLCFGVYAIGEVDAAGTSGEPCRQVGFARVVTDYTTFAWLCDVFVAEEARGHGLGKQLVETVLAHPELQGLRRWVLATRDAQELYRRFGFTDLADPTRWMERLEP